MQQILISLLMLITIVPIHEFAHAYVANKLGDGTARFNGRLTINPLAHLDLFGTIAFLLVGFGWGKPVPVYSSNLRKPKRDMMLVAMAGPASNIILATCLTIIYKLFYILFVATGFVNPVAQGILWVLISLANTSVYWAVFNLLPVPPLDGSRLLEYILPAKYYIKMEYYQRYIYIGMLVLLMTGILSGPIMFVSGFITKFINFITMPITMLANVLL